MDPIRRSGTINRKNSSGHGENAKSNRRFSAKVGSLPFCTSSLTAQKNLLTLYQTRNRSLSKPSTKKEKQFPILHWREGHWFQVCVYAGFMLASEVHIQSGPFSFSFKPSP